MENSQFTASRFDVVLLPGNNTAKIDIAAISTINNNISATFEVIIYGFSILTQKIDFCKVGVKQLCPIAAGHFDFSTEQKLDEKTFEMIPSIAYTMPDLDAIIRIKVHDDTDTALACVQATLTNGKTVQTNYASWAIAAVFGLGLFTSGIVSVLGHQNTAAHIASNAVSLFIYFQSVAIIGMMCVDRLPPMSAAWVQNFQWTMGLIEVPFLQDIFNWYVQATGGKVTSILPNRDLISYSVQKRASYATFDADSSFPHANLVRSAVDVSHNIAKSLPMDAIRQVATRSMFGRGDSYTFDSSVTTTNEASKDLSSKVLILKGIQRVAFLGNIEITNVFLTGFSFLGISGTFLIMGFVFFKCVLELLVKMNAIAPSRFLDYRQHWRTILKGIIYRLSLLAFPQLTVLCLWEFTVRDSAGTVAIAAVVYAVVFGLLSWASFKVITIARNSVRLYKNPAYILFSDTDCLNRFGFLYVQFRATAYYFIAPVLIHNFLKGIFIALAQDNGQVQAVAIFIIELIYLVYISWIKPYMDKRTNGFNIAISAINFVNAIFFLFFSDLFGQPAPVAGIMGIVFFILNAVFSLILLIMAIVSCIIALLSKNPDTRYQPMRDDRESFIPDANREKGGINGATADTELDALGASARTEQSAVIYEEDEDDYDEMNENISYGASNPRHRDNVYSLSTDPLASSASLNEISDPNLSAGVHSLTNDTAYKGGYKPTTTYVSNSNRDSQTSELWRGNGY
ncbi:TRP-domain-containing protein [Nadsonia fulvescens var. elongata DSM 6958]|uniref:TRP-domain-containing protein n=1 Tax=Nadsonia fulvescens var. elongata DSM 6958 TaxID=857566 RepID=A0A1E3PL39_9ASCO|nr:TRP-domain-containing protein [Nadsonia fulvescens var. elongata DSM 6958]